MSAKAASTRLNILNKAFGLTYRNGYRTTSVDDIIATTQVTKGAFFYHFKNKDEMGIAMINEVMYPAMTNAFTKLLEGAQDPKKAIYLMMKGLLMDNALFEVQYGCPAINLIEELAGHNPAFQHALQKLTDNWKNLIENCLENGKASGKISTGTNVEEAAIYILSGYGGIRNLGKLYGNQAYTSYLTQLRHYLNQL